MLPANRIVKLVIFEFYLKIRKTTKILQLFFFGANKIDFYS